MAKLQLFDVAVSYASENRDYVDRVVEALNYLNVSVWYDRHQEAALWGVDLRDEFISVFSTQARFVIMFVSEYYAEKMWADLERRTAFAAAMSLDRVYVLPVRFDDTKIPGLLPSVAYKDADQYEPAAIAALAVEKLAALRDEGAEVGEDDDDREPGWEYLALADAMEEGLAALDDRWRDYRIGVRRPRPDETITDVDGLELFLKQQARAAVMMVTAVEQIFDPEIMAEAFGVPGGPGDPAVLRYVGSRVVLMYESLLGWAERVRNVLAPAAFDDVLLAMARYVDLPLKQVRDFVDDFGSSVRAALARDDDAEPVTISFTLALSIDDEAPAAYGVALAQLAQRTISGEVDRGW